MPLSVKLFLSISLLSTLLIVTGCSKTVLVERESYSPIPEALLKEPVPEAPPRLMIKPQESELQMTRRHLDAMLRYARSLMTTIQETALNLRTLKALDLEKQKLHKGS